MNFQPKYFDDDWKPQYFYFVSTGEDGWIVIKRTDIQLIENRTYLPLYENQTHLPLYTIPLTVVDLQIVNTDIDLIQDITLFTEEVNNTVDTSNTDQIQTIRIGKYDADVINTPMADTKTIRSSKQEPDVIRIEKVES